MNFDEAIKYAKEYSFVQSYEYDYNLVTDLDDVIELLEKLKEEYAPRIEMTSDQKENLLMIRDNQEPIVELISEFDEGVLIHDFEPYWEPLTEKQVVQAWLNPETIVVTDSE